MAQAFNENTKSIRAAGQTVLFGKHEGKDVKWLVLANEGNKSLLIMNEALFTYKLTNVPGDYAVRVMHDIFNDGIVAFNELENDIIVKTKIDANDYDLFFLSKEEATKYFSGNTSRVYTGGSYRSKEGWWLRTVVPSNIFSGKALVYVNRDGEFEDKHYLEANVKLYPLAFTYSARLAVWVETAQL